MKIDIHNPFGQYLDVIDLATGQKLLRVMWADDEKGEYAQFPERSAPEIAARRGRPLIKRGKIEIRFVGPDLVRRSFELYMNPDRKPTTWPPRKEDMD